MELLRQNGSDSAIGVGDKSGKQKTTRGWSYFLFRTNKEQSLVGSACHSHAKTQVSSLATSLRYVSLRRSNKKRILKSLSSDLSAG